MRTGAPACVRRLPRGALSTCCADFRNSSCVRQVALKIAKDHTSSALNTELKARPGGCEKLSLRRRLSYENRPRDSNHAQTLRDLQDNHHVCQLLESGSVRCRDDKERLFIAMQVRPHVVSPSRQLCATA